MTSRNIRPIAFAKQEALEAANGRVNELEARLAVVEYAFEALLDDFDELINTLQMNEAVDEYYKSDEPLTPVSAEASDE